jgi:hypothetical protein
MKSLPEAPARSTDRSRSRATASLLYALAPLLGMALVVAPRGSFSQRTQPTHEPKQFYIVDVGEDDFYPYWSCSIFDVNSQNGGVFVTFTQVNGAKRPCNTPEIRARRIPLRGTSLERLVGGLDLCSVNVDEIDQAVRKYTRKPAAYETSRSALVARCAAGDRVFRFPAFQMDTERLRRRIPRAGALLDVCARVRNSALQGVQTWADFDRFEKTLSPEVGEASVNEMKARQFDRGFWFCNAGASLLPAWVVNGSFDPSFGSACDLQKLRRVLTEYRGPSFVPKGHAELLNKDRYPLTEYAAPEISAAHIEEGAVTGKADFDVIVDAQSGLVEDTRVDTTRSYVEHEISSAAKKWRFDTARLPGTTIKMTIDFSFECH